MQHLRFFLYIWEKYRTFEITSGIILKMNLPLYKGFTLEITNKWWPLTTLNRWPLYRIKIYSKMHRESRKVTVMRRWPLRQVWLYMHIFRHIFLSNYWWQRSDIWSQASYRYPISWEVFLGPSDSYFLFADFVDFIHIEHTFCICPFLVAFFLATIDGRNLIFGHKLHIGTPYRWKRFWTRHIPTSCLPKSGGIISEH